MWSYEVFQHHITWLSDAYQPIRFLAQALARAELVGGLPDDLRFLWIEPHKTEGFGMSGPMRKAMWKGIQAIRQRLYESGFLSEAALTVSSMFHMDPVHTTG